MKTSRHTVIHLFLLAAVASMTLAACGSPSQAQHITTIGIVNFTTGFDPMIVAFKAGLKDSGYIEGKTINYIYDGPVANEKAAVDQEIQKVAAQNPDMYLALGSIPTRELKALQPNKPVVFAPASNPEKQGIVADLLKPGGKMTGVNTAGPITANGLEWLLTVAPALKQIHVLYLHGDPVAPTQFDTLQTTADRLKVKLVLHEVKTADEAIAVVPTLTKGTDGILLIPTLFMAPPQQAAFVKTALQNGIPTGSSVFGGAPENQLTGLGVDYNKLGHQVADITQQILNGADPATMPVQPSQFTLAMNLVTAKDLGMTLPDSVLQQADTIVRVNATPAAPATQQATASH